MEQANRETIYHCRRCQRRWKEQPFRRVTASVARYGRDYRPGQHRRTGALRPPHRRETCNLQSQRLPEKGHQLFTGNNAFRTANPANHPASQRKRLPHPPVQNKKMHKNQN